MSETGRAANQRIGWEALIIPGVITASGVLTGYYFAAWTLVWAVWLGLFLPCLIPRYRALGIVAAYRVGIPLMAAVVSLIIYDVAHSNEIIAEYARLLHDDWVQITAYFQIVSTLYAICIAFTLWKAMTDHDNLKNTMRDEANELKAVLAFLEYFDNVEDSGTQKSLTKIRSNIRSYTLSLINIHKNGLDELNVGRLQNCIRLVEFLKTPEDNDKIALEGVINGLTELTMIRSRRISLTDNKISPYLIGVLGLTSLAIIAFFYVFDSKMLNAAHFVIPILAFLYTFFAVMLIDLSLPFFGYWNVKIRDFDEVLDLLEIRGGALTHSMAITDQDSPVQPQETLA